MNPAMGAKVIIERVGGQLLHAIEHLTTHVQLDGRLAPDDQHAVRIIQSRIRLLYRLYNLKHGNPQDKHAAQIEMRVAKQDNGTLVSLGEKQHAQGRLDCRACDTEEKVEGSGVLTPACTLCPVCQQGIQHVYTVQGQLGTVNSSKNEPDTRYAGLDGTLNRTGDVVKTKECDNCRAIEATPVGIVIGPKKETWKNFMLKPKQL